MWIQSSLRASGVGLALLGFAATAAVAAPGLDARFRSMLERPPVRKALEQIRTDDALTLREQIEISQIAAPPFKEAQRAQDYARRLRELGLTDVTIDSEGNVIGRRPGMRKRPVLLLTAHLDTVFPEGTDVTVREEGGRYYGKGLSDDSRGLAANLSVLRAMQVARVRTVGEIWFVGTVGEEGLGNLRGVKALLRDPAAIDGFISVDGIASPEDAAMKRTSIVIHATGSRRWSFRFDGPGGHSFDNFGLPSANHALGRAIARIADLRTTADPKTTFTVGVVSGGTAVNAISAQATMQVDIRSNDAAALAELERRIMAATQAAVADENARWGADTIGVTPELLGDRPAGKGSADSPIVRAAAQAFIALDQPQPQIDTASTDSNVAIGMGIPALTLNAGGIGFKFHSPDEWYEPVEAWLGPQQVLLTTLALVGVEGSSKPALATREAAVGGD